MGKRLLTLVLSDSKTSQFSNIPHAFLCNLLICKRIKKPQKAECGIYVE